jgi:hypothetical protein
VLAVALQDSRLNVESWVKDHPDYHFTFVTDPELPSQISRLVEYSGSPGIPVTLLIDTKGIVTDQWFGYEKSEELEKKLAQFLSPSNTR